MKTYIHETTNFPLKQELFYKSVYHFNSTKCSITECKMIPYNVYR